VTIGVGIQKRPSSVSQVGPWSSDFRLINSPSFTDGVSAVSSLIFACSATPTYFSIAAEMRDPRFFTRALIISQIGSTLIYLVIGVVVYYYCGSHVASPALGSAGPIIKKISYGIALPGLLATTTIVIHVSPLVLIYTTPVYKY
jgi:amino acid permease